MAVLIACVFGWAIGDYHAHAEWQAERLATIKRQAEALRKCPTDSHPVSQSDGSVLVTIEIPISCVIDVIWPE